MADGFVRWYETGWSAERSAERVENFERAGWSVRHPVRGSIFAVTADGMVAIDRAMFLDAVALGAASTFSFKYWYDADDSDIYCRIRRVGAGQVVQEFSIDGFPMETRNVIAVDVLSAAVAAGSTSGVIVDRLGYLEEIDWDAVVLGFQPLPELPDLLAVTGPIADEVAARWPRVARRRLGGLIVFNTVGLDIAQPR